MAKLRKLHPDRLQWIAEKHNYPNIEAMVRTEYAKENVYIKDLAVIIGVSPCYVKRGLLNPLMIPSKERIGRQKGCVGHNRKKIKHEDTRLCGRCGHWSGRKRRDSGPKTYFCNQCYQEINNSATPETIYGINVRSMP